MASGKCIYLQKALLDYALGQTLWTPPTNLWIALSTATFSSTTDGTSILTNEVSSSGTAYDRVEVPNDGTFWPLADSVGQKASLLDANWATVTGSGYGTVRSFYLCDGNAKTSADNVLYGSDLTPTVVVAGPGPSFAAGNLTVKET
jgi:hypothetical protein